MKLLLIGYRATGKSTLGRELASRMGVNFVDTDNLIENRAGKSISEIVAESGWEAFRAMERAVLDQVVHDDGDAVVACGGGAVLYEELFRHLPPDTVSVWLQAPVDLIIERMEADARSAAMRPALVNESSLKDEAIQVLSRREPLYREFSSFSLDTSRHSLSELVKMLEEIWRQVSNFPAC